MYISLFKSLLLFKIFIVSLSMFFENDQTLEQFPVPRSNSNYFFPYNLNKICQIKIVNNHMIGTVEDPYSFIRSGNSFLTSLKASQNVSILNCLNYKGYSYIFYKYEQEPYSIKILRSRIEHTFNISIKIKSLHFDHFSNNLIAVSSRNCLYSVNLTALEQYKYWTFHNQNYSKQNFLILSPLDIYVPPYKDFTTFNSSYYFISNPDNIVYILNKGPSSLSITKSISTSSPYTSSKFLTIPFPRFETLFPSSISDLDIIAISHNNPFIIHFPPPPKIDAKKNGLWHYYLIDILIYILAISIFLFIARLMYLKIHKSDKKQYKYIEENIGIMLDTYSRDALQNNNSNNSAHC